ncbi:patatin-like phospholipase family protein [Rummeliibacillus sp. JY-2-4R]
MLVDGVFSGGGIKGFALVGALQVLEENDIYFERVAGTSAGAILACFLAAGYTAHEIEKMLDELDVATFLDPPKTFFSMPFMRWINLYFRMGIYQGKALEKWFYEKLSDKDIYTFEDLPEGSLKLIASDLTNGKMLVLPDDLINYGIEPGGFLVSKALRMSCGVPFFFQPVKLSVAEGESIVVDGGVLSNFPIWLYDIEYGIRPRPVIGLKLSHPQEQMKPHKIENGLNLFEALFSTMQNAHDERYISRKHEKHIIFIPVENYNATQFELTQEMKENLMEIGRNKAKQFLKSWTASAF